jgi:hypothetical protein
VILELEKLNLKIKYSPSKDNLAAFLISATDESRYKILATRIGGIFELIVSCRLRLSFNK